MSNEHALPLAAHALACGWLLAELWRAARAGTATDATPVWASAVGGVAVGLLLIDAVVLPLGAVYRGPVQYYPHGFGATVFRLRAAAFPLTMFAVPVCGVGAVLAAICRLADGASTKAPLGGWGAACAWAAAGGLAVLQFFLWGVTGAFPTV